MQTATKQLRREDTIRIQLTRFRSTSFLERLHTHTSRRGKRMKFPPEVTRFPWKLPEPLEPRVCAITGNSSTLRRHEWAWSDVRRKRRVALASRFVIRQAEQCYCGSHMCEHRVRQHVARRRHNKRKQHKDEQKQPDATGNCFMTVHM